MSEALLNMLEEAVDRLRDAAHASADAAEMAHRRFQSHLGEAAPDPASVRARGFYSERDRLRAESRIAQARKDAFEAILAELRPVRLALTAAQSAQDATKRREE